MRKVDIIDFAQPVFRMMNEQYFQEILRGFQSAAVKENWCFCFTTKEIPLPESVRNELEKSIFPTRNKYLAPFEDDRDAEYFAASFIERGEAYTWLEGILKSLASLGIRPVPLNEDVTNE